MRWAIRLAAGAALLATLGDGLLLAVASARRAALPTPPGPTLALGHFLGVLAIPLYALGYWHVGRVLAVLAPARGRAVCVLGALGAALGAVVHGMTALLVGLEAPGESADPTQVVLAGGSLLLPLWGILAALLLAGSALYAATVAGGRSTHPRWMAACNPALLVAATVAFAQTSPWLAAFLAPAAPNLAHVVFFGLCALHAPRPGAEIPATSFEGGCHCGAVRFRVTLTALRALDCNCSICRRKGTLHLIVPRERFELLRGEDALATYTFGTHVAKHRFCRVCGVSPFYVPRSHPDGVDVNARCLDAELGDRLRVEPFDGVHWERSVEALRARTGPRNTP